MDMFVIIPPQKIIESLSLTFRVDINSDVLGQ